MNFIPKSLTWAIRVFDKKENSEVYSVYGLKLDEAMKELREIESLYFTGSNERFEVTLANIQAIEVRYE